MQDDETLPTPPPRKRNPLLRLLGFAIRAPLGCMAFIAGLVTVFAIALPSLASSKAGDLLVVALEDSFAGLFEVDDVTISWVEEQRIDELVVSDPDGDPVATVSAAFPSLLDLAKGGLNYFGRSVVNVDASLVRFEDGSWNWQRALSMGDEGGGTDGNVVVSGGDESSRAYRGEVDLVVDWLTVEDRMPGGASSVLEIEDFRLSAALKPGQHTRVDGVGQLASPQSGELTLSVDLGPQQAKTRGDFPFESAELRIETVPVVWVDGFLRGGGLLTAAVGPTARMNLKVDTRDNRRTLRGTLELVGESGSLRARDPRDEHLVGRQLEAALAAAHRH
ncbi:MAG: hypothetical protein AAFZ65_11135, partial [Planctomycetota bacterium]